MTQRNPARWNAIATAVIFGAAGAAIIPAFTLLALALATAAVGLQYLGAFLWGVEAAQVRGIEWATFGATAAPQAAILAACTAAILISGRVAHRTAYLRD